MFKKLIALILCGMILLCLIACRGNSAVSSDVEYQSETDYVSQNETVDTSSKVYDTLFDEYPKVFVTEDITKITFYGYYGQGTASEVPAENMEEIINWLDSFVIEKVVDDALDGINTHYVEIEYADGTIIKEGTDLIIVDGVSYYIKGAKEPECFDQIISRSTIDEIEANTSSIQSETTSVVEETETQEKIRVFDTENIAKISFITRYGYGDEIEVPSEYMEEIIEWLGSFTTGEKLLGKVPPGTNTTHIKIEYSNGTIFENGLGTASIDGVIYYLEHDIHPDIYYEILDMSEVLDLISSNT